MELRLTNCGECEEIPMLAQFPHLKCLYLWGLTNVRSVGSSFYGIDNCSPSSCSDNGVLKKKIILFRALERLELLDMSNLEEWVQAKLPSAHGTQLFELVVFPRLEYLRIKKCRKLISSPSNFPCLKELDISEMDSGLPLASICGTKLVSLTQLEIDGLDGLVCLPDVSISNCPSLKRLVPCLGDGRASLRELRVRNCLNLKELPDNIHSFNSLQTLWIQHCPNLKSIPYPNGAQSQGFTSLKYLLIVNCEGLTNLPREMMELCGPSLETITLHRLRRTYFPTVLGCLQKMPHLRILSIQNVPKLLDSSEVEIIGSLSSLQELDIGCTLESDPVVDNVSFKLSIDSIFRGVMQHSLRRLELHGMEHWDSLPDQLQHLTALMLLQLDGFGIEALPEWLGHLSSLESLHLWVCKKLRSLASKEAMQRLTKLTDLHIQGCPLLEEQIHNDQQQSDGGSQLSKISHIPNITVDWRRI